MIFIRFIMDNTHSDISNIFGIIFLAVSLYAIYLGAMLYRYDENIRAITKFEKFDLLEVFFITSIISYFRNIVFNILKPII